MVIQASSPLLFPVAYAASLLFECGVRVRNHFYDSGLLSQRQLPHPVISVGNLTVGGSGKTPLAIHLAQTISRLGRTPVLLSRGYCRQTKQDLVLSPNEEIASAAQVLGDEPALVRRHASGLWLGIAARRWKVGMKIAPRVEHPVFILDDGFQHRRLRRDLNILVIDRLQPLGRNRVLPLGSLREPPAGLRRADLIVINGADHSISPDPVENEVRSIKPEATIFHCAQKISQLAPILRWRGQSRDEAALGNPSSAFLVAAIGNPERFRRDVQALGIEVLGARFFRDHSTPGLSDWQACAAEARAKGASSLITTEKDAIKLHAVPDFPLLVAAQSIRLFEQIELEARLRVIMEADR